MFLVLLDFDWQPIGSWRRPDKTEERGGLQNPFLGRRLVQDFDRAEMTIAEHAYDFGAAKYLDVGRVHDSVRQIARHALAKIVAPNQQGHFAHVLRKIDRRLSGRVATADQYYVRSAAHLRFVRRGRVIDAATLELLATFHAEFAILRAARDEQAFGNYRVAILQP